MKRNWESVFLKALGGKDFRLTVVGAESIGTHYQRLLIDGGGLLTTCQPHPTMWIRLWFEDNGRAHQRAYTIVDPDPVADRFTLEFALHDGPAANWAVRAQVGDSIVATVQGSAFVLPDPAPEHLFVAGDAASLPAVNSLLDAAPDVAATVWLDYADPGEQALPVRARAHHSVMWVPRSASFVDTVVAGLRHSDRVHYWIAGEAANTRAITKHARRVLGAEKHRITSVGYWSR